VYYSNQKRKLSDEEWMESVMSQMIGDTKPIVEQAAAVPSKTTTEFLGAINAINAMFLKNKNAMPVDTNEVKALQDSLGTLGKSIPALQGEMQAAAKAQAAVAKPPAQAQAQPQTPGAAQAKAPVPGAPAPAAPAQGQPQAAQAPAAPAR
jgi:hypothetical protein